MYRSAALVFLLFAGVAHAEVATEARVREFFSETPVMIEIARCESKFRQFADSGSPLYGGMGGVMVGVFQVHTSVHQSFARSVLGYDITTLEGNLGYAKYLYQTEGTKPWASSYACWGNVSTTATTAVDLILTANLSFGMIHPQVTVLQKALNQKGFTIATEGPGSPGQETQLFGALTRAAVQKFQCATISVCGGSESATGFGRVGPRTRTAITSTPSSPAVVPTSATTTPISTPTSTASTSAASSSGGGGYTPAQQTEVTQLQAQIEELTAFLELYQIGEQQP